MTSEARFFVNISAQALIWGGIVGLCAFAWFKGRPAERYGAAVFAVASFGTLGIEIGTGQAVPVLPALLLDTVVALVFLALAIRYNNLWLGAAMMVKGAQLALHASHLTELDDAHVGGFNLYAASLNLITLLILLIFLAATLASIRARRKAVRAPPQSPYRSL